MTWLQNDVIRPLNSVWALKKKEEGTSLSYFYLSTMNFFCWFQGTQLLEEFILSRVSSALSPAKLARTGQQLKFVFDLTCLVSNKEQ